MATKTDITPALEVVEKAKLGSRQGVENFFHPDCGGFRPMLVILNDVDHLKSARSPFFRFDSRLVPARLSVAHFHRVAADAATTNPTLLAA